MYVAIAMPDYAASFLYQDYFINEAEQLRGILGFRKVGLIIFPRDMFDDLFGEGSCERTMRSLATKGRPLPFLRYVMRAR